MIDNPPFYQSAVGYGVKVGVDLVEHNRKGYVKYFKGVKNSAYAAGLFAEAVTQNRGFFFDEGGMQSYEAQAGLVEFGIGEILSALTNAPPTNPGPRDMLDIYYMQADDPVMMYSMSENEKKASSSNSFFTAYPQYEYLIEDPVERRAFTQVVEEAIQDIQTNKDVVQYSEYSAYEKNVITTMLQYVADLNDSATMEILFVQDSLKEYEKLWIYD